MRVTVFRGPSIGSREATTLLEEQGLVADVRPPAAQGDVWDAAREGARVVVLVDGVYENVPAVWHKELLATLASGVRVLGAASMGALRAAECHPFGMLGYGEVYAQVRDGRILADADVAVAHRDEADDHRALTVAMVDVRATLVALVGAGLLTAGAASALGASAEALHFRQRSWPAIAHAAELPTLAPLLREHHVDVKHRDAVGVLAALSALLDAPVADVPTWRLHASDAWRRAAPESLDPIAADLLRLHGRWTDLQRAGLLRRAAEELVPPVPAEVALDELATVAATAGLTPAEWADRAGVAPADLPEFAARQARVSRLWQRLGSDATARIPDQLRLEGSWSDLVEATGRRATAPANEEPDDALWSRYAARTGAAEDADANAAALGFPDRHALLAALRREAAVGEL